MSVTRPIEDQDVSRTSNNPHVKGVGAVCCHDNNNRWIGTCEIINPSYQRVHADPIFMVHFRSLAALTERIGLINKEDRSDACISVGGPPRLRVSAHPGESG